MFDNFYSLIIVNFFFFYIIKKINDNYFRLKNKFYFIVLLYHLGITTFYIVIFKNGAADYKTYLALTTFDGFFERAYVSSDLITTFIAFLKLILNFSDLNIVILFSLISFIGTIFFYKNLISIGLTKKLAQLLIFIPSMHFWTCPVGKDSLIFLFLNWFFYLYVNKKLYFAILLIFFTFLIRPHIGVIFFSSFLITELFLIKGHKKFLIFILFLAIFYLILTTGSVSYFFISTDTLSTNPIINVFHRISVFMDKFGVSDTSYENSNFIINIFSYIFFPLEFILKKKFIYG